MVAGIFQLLLGYAGAPSEEVTQEETLRSRRARNPRTYNGKSDEVVWRSCPRCIYRQYRSSQLLLCHRTLLPVVKTVDRGLRSLPPLISSPAVAFCAAIPRQEEDQTPPQLRKLTSRTQLPVLHKFRSASEWVRATSHLFLVALHPEQTRMVLIGGHTSAKAAVPAKLLPLNLRRVKQTECHEKYTSLTSVQPTSLAHHSYTQSSITATHCTTVHQPSKNPVNSSPTYP